jgi:hypothetical protein
MRAHAHAEIKSYQSLNLRTHLFADLAKDNSQSSTDCFPISSCPHSASHCIPPLAPQVVREFDRPRGGVFLCRIYMYTRTMAKGRVIGCDGRCSLALVVLQVVSGQSSFGSSAQWTKYASSQMTSYALLFTFVHVQIVHFVRRGIAVSDIVCSYRKPPIQKMYKAVANRIGFQNQP